MKHASHLAALCQRAFAGIVAFVALAILAAPARAAITDISNNPIASSTSAAVKPNIMLLMDASGSMARTHMPDELETTAGPTSIGYKSSQCNVLYYNPAQTYVLPKLYDGSSFPTPSFNGAPYAGFGSYYAVQDLSTTDLRSQFVAYDNTTLDVAPAYPDTPQRGYYYVYTGPQTLKFDAQPCTQHDTGGTVAATGGGTWTKVTPTSQAEQDNFAIWYSYYRTRISLIKSAASLAFSPLNDTKRVGFITVEPKDTPSSTSINPIRYLPVGDFDTAQKNLWFNKVFSQKPKGASPAREGLARVGRYYAGLDDGINSGMAATGTNDPNQYACQQNFTIMTTDGYWNGQSETPGGGGVQLDGTTLVGQQDGNQSDAYSHPPMWDGTSAITRVVTNKVNAYSDGVCSLVGNYRSTFQMQKEIDDVTKDTTRTVRDTRQYYVSTRQDWATSVQTTKLVTQTTQSTLQYMLSKYHQTKETYQIWKSQEQTTKVTEQYQLTTSQTVAQTFQTRQVQTQTYRTDEQWMTAKQQYVYTTTQYMMQKDQYRQSAQQVIKHQYQTIAYDHSDEHGDALPGSCTPSAGNYPIECRQTEVFVPQFVDPSTCTPDPTGSYPNYVKTTCTPGPQTAADAPVPYCAPGTTNSGAPDYVVTTCNFVNVTPQAAFNGTCVAGPSQGGGPDYFVYTCTLPPANNTSTPVAPCTVQTTPGTYPDWITTSCSMPVGPNNQPPTPSLPCTVGSVTDGQMVTTTCTKPLDTAGYAATCVSNPGTGSPFIKTTCTPSVLGNVATPSASCSAGTGGGPGYIVTTCPSGPAGPYATPTPVQTCSQGSTSGSPDYYETTCTNPPATNQTAFVTPGACGPIGLTAATSPYWITSDCERPPGANNQTSYSDPALCFDDPGTAYPYLHVTCNTAQTMPPTVVDPSTCTVPVSMDTAANGYVVTRCQKINLTPPTAVVNCTAPPPSYPDWIVTACGGGTVYEAVQSCVPGYVGNSGYPDYYDITCVQNGPYATYVSPCVESPHPPLGPDYIDVTCSAPAVLFNQPVDPATCTAGTSAGPNVQVTTCTTVPAGTYAVPAPVAAPCVPGMDGSFIVTTCSNPPGPNNQGPTASPPCALGPSTDNNQVTTTCAMTPVVEYVPTALCSPVTQTGSGPAVTCTTTPTLGTPDGSCTAPHVDGAPYYDTTTACHTSVNQPMANAPSCTAGVGPGPGQLTSCQEIPVDVLVSDSTCTSPTDTTDANGLRKHCSVLNTGGHKYYVTETDTVTTTPYSGSVPTGPGVTVTTVIPTTAVDNTCYLSPQVFTAQPPVSVAGCSAWPCTVDIPGATGSENSLADVSQYYYRTNLRPSAPPEDQNRVIPLDVNDGEADNATHQHMTTFVVALGVSGTLTFDPNYRSLSNVTGDFADIRTTVKRWPLWPDPSVNYANSDNYNNKKAIDDYWHTAVNGRGLYFSADNPTSVINGLGNALFNTDGGIGSGAADAVSTLQPVAGNNFVYSTSYKPGPWYGDVASRVIDPSTGILSGPNAGQPDLPYWSARTLLDAKVAANCDDRRIFVIHNGNSLSDFTWNTKKCPGATGPGIPAADGLDATEQGYFSALNVSLLSQYPFMTDGTGVTQPQQQTAQQPGMLVNFLRGQRGYEDFTVGSLTNLWRKRTSVLGDIIDSQAVYVQAPFAQYAENGYDGFKTANASRRAMLYVGANDGMLHAFYAGISDPLGGQEAWAIIPSSVLPNMYKLADYGYPRGQHEFLVDGTPVVGDAYIGGAWKTMLVGGLNAGGKGYYALDVTTAGSLPTPLWEFKQDNGQCPATTSGAVGNTGDCNLGLTFGKPVITKLGTQWVVMVTSGYNNVNGAGNGQDGVGFLYVLDAQTGTIVQKIATTGGSPGTPSGLAQINNFTDNGQIDNTTLRVYGGDVLGNMWRFDFTATPTATLLGTAKDAGNAIEPITVRPELAELNGKPFVMFGTGRLLGASDVIDPQKQSVYGFTDPLIGASPIYADPIRSSLRKVAISHATAASGATRTTSCVADCGLPAGWVLDLDEAGERVNVEMHLVLGALVFTSNVPQLIPCDVGGHSWFNQVDFRTGGPVSSSDPSVITSQYLSDAINVGFNTIQLLPPSGSYNPRYVGLTRDSRGRGATPPITPLPPPPIGKRISWREIPTQ